MRLKKEYFSFTLPKAVEKQIIEIIEKQEFDLQQQSEITTEQNFLIKKILVVDDDVDVARIIKGHLEKEG